jgi:uncharacterized protein (TIGR02118 family)
MGGNGSGDLKEIHTTHTRNVNYKKEEGPMIKVSVLYPYEEGKKFDMDYYINRHLRSFQEWFGSACIRIEVDQGISGGEPGSNPPYIAIFHGYFDSVEAYVAALTPHVEALIADMPNYSDIQPIVQISEIKM